MRSILSGIVAAVVIAVAASFLLHGGLQQEVGEAYHTSGARL